MFAAQRLRQASTHLVIPGTITVNPSGQTTAAAGNWQTSGATMSFTNNVTSGNGVLTLLTSNSSGSDSFTSVTGCGVTSNQQLTNSFAAFWWGNGSSGGAKTLTISDTSSLWAGIAIEISGIVGAPIATTSAGNTGSYSTTATITPTHSGQLAVFAVVGNYGGLASLTTSGFTTIAPAGVPAKLAYQVASSTSAITATWTASGPIYSLGVLLQ